MFKWLFFVLICIIIFSGCAAVENPYRGVPRESVDKPSGFWLGLWHGFIIPVTFVVSLFKSSINIYEIYNTGSGYNLGFMIGIMIIMGGGSGGSTTVVHKRR